MGAGFEIIGSGYSTWKYTVASYIDTGIEIYELCQFSIVPYVASYIDAGIEIM